MRVRRKALRTFVAVALTAVTLLSAVPAVAIINGVADDGSHPNVGTVI